MTIVQHPSKCFPHEDISESSEAVSDRKSVFPQEVREHRLIPAFAAPKK